MMDFEYEGKNSMDKTIINCDEFTTQEAANQITRICNNNLFLKADIK